MDIEGFYDADPRRRSSAEIELGEDWHDGHGVRYELSWVEDTGEVYVMREPVPVEWATPFGGLHVRGMHSADEKEIAGMTVAVIATVPTRERMEEIFAGWQDAIAGPDSVAWVVQRLRSAGVLASGASAVTS